MSSQPLLRVLLVVVGVVNISMGLQWLPVLMQWQDMLGGGLIDDAWYQARLMVPMAFGALLVLASGPLSNLFRPRDGSAEPMGFAGFTESLLAVSGIVLVGLALLDLASLAFVEATQLLRPADARDWTWAPYPRIFGQLLLGCGLILSRSALARQLERRTG